MDVGRQTDLQEERMIDRRSLSSQSRKISIGVLVDSVSKAKTKDLQAETETYSRRNCAKDEEGHTPLMGKHVTDEPKDASPWVSTRSFNPKISSSVVVQDTEHICSMETGKVDNAEHVENPVSSPEQGVRLEKEQVQGKDRTTETGEFETMRIKLWEILGNVSSPNKHLPSFQFKELHQDQENNGKQRPIENMNPNSDTMESDSQTHTLTRPMTSSLTWRKGSTIKQSNKSEATKSIDAIDCRPKRIVTFSCLRKELRGDGLNAYFWPLSSYDDSSESSLPPYKRKQIMGMSSGVETYQGVKPKNVEERQQS